MPKTEFTQELSLGLSGGKTANPTTFFIGDQHLLTSAGRELYLMPTQSFEQGRINGLQAPAETKRVPLSIEAQEWMKKNPNAQFQDGKASAERNFFIFNMDFPGQEIELAAAQVGVRHPVLFYLVYRSIGSKRVDNWLGGKKEKQVYWVDQTNRVEKSLSPKNHSEPEISLKMLEFREFKNTRIESMDLYQRNEELQLLALTEETPQSIVMFSFRKMRTVGLNCLVKADKYHYLAVNPDDKFLNLLSSRNHRRLKLHRINDKMKGDEYVIKSASDFKGLGAPQWISSSCFAVAARETFSIYILGLTKKLKMEMRQKVESFDRKIANNLFDIVNLKSFSQGLIASLNDGSSVVIANDKEGLIRYKLGKLEDKKNRFLPVARFKTGENPRFLEFSANEEKALIISKNCSLSVIDAGTLLGQKKFNPSMLNDFNMNCRNLEMVEHNFTRKKGVYDQVNLAKFKPLALMVSRDQNKLVLMDYVRKKIRMQVGFDKLHDRQLLSGAIHPSGLFSVLGFQENLCFYAITDGELRKQKNGPNKMILINSFSFQILDIMNWHPGVVTGFLFTNNDQSFISCCRQGSILGYRLASQTKHEIYREKEIEFLDLKEYPRRLDEARAKKIKKNTNSLFKSKSNEPNINCGFVALGRDTAGLHFIFLRSTYESTVRKIWINFGFDFNMNTQLKVEKFFWVQPSSRGLESGNALDFFEREQPIDFYFFDSQGFIVKAQNIFQEKRGTDVILTQSTSYVVCLTLSRSCNLVFASFADGSFLSWSSNMQLLQKNKDHPKELIEFKGKKEKDKDIEERKDDLVLVDQAAVIEFRKMRVRYEAQIKDLVVKNQVKLAEEQEKAAKELEKVEDELRQEIRYKDKVIQEVRKEKEEIEGEVTKLLKKMESQHLSAAEELEKIYEQKIENEGKKILELERKVYLERLSQQKKIQKIAEENLKQVQDVKKESESILKAQRMIEEETQKQLNKLEVNFFRDYDEQEKRQNKIRALNDQRHKKREMALEGEVSRLKTENETYRRAAKKAALSEQVMTEKLKILEDKLKSSEAKVLEMEELSEMSREELSRLRSRLSSKEMNMEHLKKRITELEKLKNVLCFKNDELSRALKPKEIVIEGLREKLARNEGECDGFMEKMREKDNNLAFESSKLKKRILDMRLREKELRKKNTLIKTISQMVSCTVQVRDSKVWDRCLRDLNQLLKQYEIDGKVQPQIRKAYAKSSEMLLREMGRHINGLERDLMSRGHQQIRGDARNKRHVHRKIDENNHLIKEINDLRVYNKRWKMEIRNLESKLRSQISKNGHLVKQSRMRKSLPKKSITQESIHTKDWKRGLSVNRVCGKGLIVKSQKSISDAKSDEKFTKSKT